MKREYSDAMLPIVEGKPVPRSVVILDNGEWKTRWWYPEPDDNVDKPCSSSLEAVVYCKDCKKRNQHKECAEGYGYHSDDWFCADGERKETT